MEHDDKHGKKSYKKPSNPHSWTLRGVATLVAEYRIYVFIKRNFVNYMFLRYHFVFFDFTDFLVLFIFDYAVIMGLLIYIGYYISVIFAQKLKR